MAGATSASAGPGEEEFHFPSALATAIGRKRVLQADAETGSRVLFEARADFAHSGGTIVQGGFVTAWLDHAMAVAAAAREPGRGVASLEIKVTFLEPVRLGEVVAEGRIRRWGRSIAFLEAFLHAADGRLLATASSCGKILGPPSGSSR